MRKALKCPKCRKQTAWKFWGIVRKDDEHRHYHMKHCSCGYEGKRVYGSWRKESDCIICDAMRRRREETNEKG